MSARWRRAALAFLALAFVALSALAAWQLLDDRPPASPGAKSALSRLRSREERLLGAYAAVDGGRYRIPVQRAMQLLKERPALLAPESAASDGGPASAPAADAGPLGAARIVYSERCSLCHGRSGRGDGPVGRKLKPRPRDYADPAWQRSTTDKQIAEIIIRGGVATNKSPAMPAHPDLQQKVTDLVSLIRSFGRAAKRRTPQKAKNEASDGTGSTAAPAP